MNNNNIPKVREFPIIGKFFTLKSYLHDRLSYLQKLHNEYGDIFELQIGPRKLIVVSNPEIVQQVMQKNMKNYIKKINFEAFLGKSIFTTNNEEWKRQRDLLKPLFSMQFLQSSLPQTQEIIKEKFSLYLQNPTSFSDIRSLYTKIAFEIILKLIIGVDIKEKIKIIDDAITHITHYLTNDNYTFFPFLKTWNNDYKTYEQSLKNLNNEMYPLIAHARKNPEGKSFIHYLIHADSTLSDEFIRDNLLTVIVAGYETTAMTMSWLSYLLATNESWQNQCIAEAKIFAQKKPSYQDLLELKTIDACLNETMRLYPAGWAFTRMAVEDDTIKNYHIKAGDLLLICPYLSHRDSKYWNNTQQFNPERFLSDNENAIDRFVFYPFGAGPRTCLGMTMGLMEMKSIILEILANHKFKMNGALPIPDARATIYSRNGFAVSIEKQ